VTDNPQAQPARRPRAPRSTRASLAQIVLGFEVIVVGLASLVAMGLGALPVGLALGGGAALDILMLIAVALIPRYSWSFGLGWAAQAIIVASGFVLQMMFLLGIVFTAIWTYAMITGARLDSQKAQS